MALPPGTRIGPYEVVSLLGAGGMGEVYRARDPRLRRDAALKVISQPLTGDSRTVDRFIREALAVSALNHPNVVTIYEAGESSMGRYIAMELIQGRTLRELVREGLHIEQARDIGRQVAEALAVAHAAQIVHRDVKPENVMIREDGYVKVLDFGLARLEPDVALEAKTISFATHTGVVLGTIGYMSPEQARGEAVTTASDVFAFGIVLYEAMTRQHPFPAATPLGVLHAILSDAPLAPWHLQPDVPAPVGHLVLECLQKDPRLRPTTAEVASRLRGSAVIPIVAARPASPAATPLATVPPHIVGREDEGQAMAQALAQASAGRGLVLHLAGEPGFGKTTLVEHALATLASEGAAFRTGRGRCSERLAGSDAYLPLLEALESLLRNETHGSLVRVMRTVAPSWYAQIASQPDLGAESAREALDEGPGSQLRLKREMTAFLQEASRLVPIVLFIDDVHWADQATIDLLAHLGTHISHMRVLLVATSRASALARAKHPFLAVKLELQARGICREVTLGSLPAAAVAGYIGLEFPDHDFPPAFVDLVHHKTEGHPLFLADLLRDLRQRGAVERAGGRWRLASGLPAIERQLPESVRSMIQRKIDALSAEERQLLTAAAVQGVDFDSAVVAYVADRDESDVEDDLERLEREHAFVRFVGDQRCPDRTVTLRFRFAHVLYQNAVYASLRATRRATLAGAVASALVRRWGDRAPEIALELAVLFETARGTLAAARYYGLAAQAAAQLFASHEALQLAAKGLTLLAELPDNTARRGVEIELQMTRALAIKTGTGYAVPEVGEAYRRARDLSHQVDDAGQLVPVLIGLSAHYIGAGEISDAYELAEQLVEVSSRVGDPHLTMVAEWCLGAALHHLGELRAAEGHLTRAMETYDPAFHESRAWQVGIEPGIFCQCELARVSWMLGRPDVAVERCLQVETQARRLGHAQTLAFTLLFHALIRQLRREPVETRAICETLLPMCAEKGIAQERIWTRVVHGWSLCETGEIERGLREIDEGLAEHDARRSQLLRPYFRALHAAVLLRIGRTADAVAPLEQAIAVGAATGQRMFDPEVLRLRAEWMHRSGRAQAEVRTLFEMALEKARAQEALSLELRASVSFGRWLLERGERETAASLVAGVSARFTEGHDTVDLRDAAALLAEADGTP